MSLKTMNFRELRQSDLAYMEAHSRDPEFYKSGQGDVDFLYALEDGEDILAIGGFRLFTKETAWCWIDITDTGVRNKFSMYRVIYEWIEKFCEVMKIWRLEACVRTDFAQGALLVQHLGFESSGVKRNFFGKYDAILYVKLFERE